MCSKSLSPVCAPGSNIALAFRDVLTDQKSTNALNLVPALAALNKSAQNMKEGLNYIQIDMCSLI